MESIMKIARNMGSWALNVVLMLTGVGLVMFYIAGIIMAIIAFAKS